MVTLHSCCYRHSGTCLKALRHTEHKMAGATRKGGSPCLGRVLAAACFGHRHWQRRLGGVREVPQAVVEAALLLGQAAAERAGPLWAGEAARGDTRLWRRQLMLHSHKVVTVSVTLCAPFRYRRLLLLQVRCAQPAASSRTGRRRCCSPCCSPRCGRWCWPEVERKQLRCCCQAGRPFCCSCCGRQQCCLPYCRRRNRCHPTSEPRQSCKRLPASSGCAHACLCIRLLPHCHGAGPRRQHRLLSPRVAKRGAGARDCLLRAELGHRAGLKQTPEAAALQLRPGLIRARTAAGQPCKCSIGPQQRPAGGAAVNQGQALIKALKRAQHALVLAHRPQPLLLRCQNLWRAKGSRGCRGASTWEGLGGGARHAVTAAASGRGRHGRTQRPPPPIELQRPRPFPQLDKLTSSRSSSRVTTSACTMCAWVLT